MGKGKRFQKLAGPQSHTQNFIIDDTAFNTGVVAFLQLGLIYAENE